MKTNKIFWVGAICLGRSGDSKQNFIYGWPKQCRPYQSAPLGPFYQKPHYSASKISEQRLVPTWPLITLGLSHSQGTPEKAVGMILSFRTERSGQTV